MTARPRMLLAVVLALSVMSAPVAVSADADQTTSLLTQHLSVGSEHTTDTDFGNAAVRDGFNIDGTGDSASLVGPVSFIDDFEDGQTTPDNNWSDYNQRTGSGTFIAQTGTVLDGTYSGEITSSNDFEGWSTTRSSPTTNDLEIVLQIDQQSGNTGDYARVETRAGGANGDQIAMVEFVGDGDIVYDPNGAATVIGSWSADTTYRLAYDFNFSANTVDILLNGTVLSTEPFITAASEYDNIQFSLQTEGTGGSNSLFLDDIGPKAAGATAGYVSQNHTVENAETATVNVTSISDVTANATVEYYDGSSWVAANTTSLTSSGVATMQLPDVSADTWRTTINASKTTASGEIEVASEAIRFASSEPSVSNGQPTDDLTVSSTTLSVDVSDSDFGLAQGDTVTVEFREDGTLIGTNTTTSNGTVSVPYNDIAGGTHDITATATDEYGNTATTSWTFTTPSTLYIRNESDPSQLINQSTTVTVTFFSDDGQIVERTTSDGTVNLTGLNTNQKFVAEVSAQNYHSRSVVIESLTEQQSIYLLNTSVSSVEVRFTLNNPSGEFESSTTELYIERALTRNGTTEYRTIASDTFGVTGFTTNLESDVRYRLRVESEDGNTRILGSYDAATSKTVTIEPEPLGVNITDGSAYTWDTRYNDSTDSIIFQFSDPSTQTTDLEYTIYEYNNSSNVLVPNTTISGPLGDARITEPLTPNETNTTWVVEWSASRNGETVGGRATVGRQVRTQFTELPDWMKLGTASVFTILVAAVFSRRNFTTGAVSTSLVAGGWWFAGWLPAAAGGPVVAALGLSVLYKTGVINR